MNAERAQAILDFEIRANACARCNEREFVCMFELNNRSRSCILCRVAKVRCDPPGAPNNPIFVEDDEVDELDGDDDIVILPNGVRERAVSEYSPCLSFRTS